MEFFKPSARGINDPFNQDAPLTSASSNGTRETTYVRTPAARYKLFVRNTTRFLLGAAAAASRFRRVTLLHVFLLTVARNCFWTFVDDLATGGAILSPTAQICRSFEARVQQLSSIHPSADRVVRRRAELPWRLIRAIKRAIHRAVPSDAPGTTFDPLACTGHASTRAL